MLSNNADQFMTTPMPTSVTTQANLAAREEMPAPRATSRTQFLPGMAGMPGMNGYVTDQAYRGTGAINMGDPRVLLAAAGLAAGLWLMTRKPKATPGRAKRR